MGASSPATSTVYDLLFLALREVGIISLGDVVPANVMQEAMLVLNSIRAGWSLNVKNYQIYDQVVTIGAQTPSISLGVGGDIATRPSSIDQVTVIAGSNPGSNLVHNVPIFPYEDYRSLVLTNVFAVPAGAYIDTSYPKQNIWFYPGLCAGWSVRVQGMAYMTDYANVSDPFMDPPEWFAPLYLAPGLRLAPKYGVDMDSVVYQQCAGELKHLTANMMTMRIRNMPNGLKQRGSGFNFYAGM